MAGRLLGPWLCVLVAAVALAGCLRSGPQPVETVSSSTGPAGTTASSSGSASLPLTSASPSSSSSSGPTGHVVVTVGLNRTSLRPGELVDIRIKAANPGPGFAPVADWCNPPWTVKLTGPDGNSTFSTDTGRYCPSRGMTSGEPPPRWDMPPGAAVWLNLTWDGRTPFFRPPPSMRNDAAPGPYVLTATYDGAPPGTANVTVLPVPAMRVWFDNATALNGHNVTVHAAFSNPTNETVFYAVDCAGAPWGGLVTSVSADPDGSYMTRGAVEPSPPPCGDDPGRLEPGQSVEQAFLWNGTMYNSWSHEWYHPDWDIYVQVSAAYGPTPNEATARSVAGWAHVYVCGSPRAPCPR